jgi:hypothetical protein
VREASLALVATSDDVQEANRITDVEAFPFRGRMNLLYYAYSLVTESVSLAIVRSKILHKIRSAETSCFDTDEHLAFVGLWNGYIIA